MVDDYPEDFEHPDYQAWLQERETEILERMAWEKMEKEYTQYQEYPWQQNQKQPSTTGSKATSRGFSKGLRRLRGLASRISGRLIKGKVFGSNSKPSQPQTFKSEKPNMRG